MDSYSPQLGLLQAPVQGIFKWHLQEYTAPLVFEHPLAKRAAALDGRASNALALDAVGNVYVAGFSFSEDPYTDHNATTIKYLSDDLVRSNSPEFRY